MNVDTNLIKIGGKLCNLYTIEYFNIGGMGAAILNIKGGFIKNEIRFIKVVILTKLVYLGGK